MPDTDPRVFQVSTLQEEGRHAEALALLQELFAEAEHAALPFYQRMFMVMFQWKMLAGEYAPAREALRDVRDDQIARLLAGDEMFGRSGQHGPETSVLPRTSRFSLIVDINRTLEDPQSTHALFARLDAEKSDLVRRCWWQALPHVVEAGDFALADRYRGDPLALLAAVNAAACDLPLFPPSGKAPRLAAELTNLVGEVRIGVAVLRGQGHETEANALGAALLAGLESDEVRALAARELIAPGTITNEIVARQMAHEEQGGSAML